MPLLLRQKNRTKTKKQKTSKQKFTERFKSCPQDFFVKNGWRPRQLSALERSASAFVYRMILR